MCGAFSPVNAQFMLFVQLVTALPVLFNAMELTDVIRYTSIHRLGSPQILAKINRIPLRVGGVDVFPLDAVPDLSVIIDS